MSGGKFDFIIVGGGIAGASAGYALAARAKVVLLERERVFGYHTTGRSAALYLRTHGPAVIRALARGSQTFFLNPPPGFTETPLVTPRGVVFIGRKDQAAEIDREARDNSGALSSVRRLDEGAVRAMVPAMRPGYVAAAMLDPEAMDIDVHAVHDGFLRAMRHRGAETLTEAEVTRVERVGNSWKVHTPRGIFEAPAIINAAGAWCDKLGRLAGAKPIGLVPKRRTIVVFDPPEGAEIKKWPAVNDIGEQFYFKPDAGRILASPEDETPMEPCDVFPDDTDVATAIQRVETAADLKVKTIVRKWAGLRSFVADGIPAVGYDPELAGFFWLAGQGGYGIETSPAMGRLVASLALREGVPKDLAELGVTEDALSPKRLRR
ncbi:MAG TPA: FAD-binding oxidoreductase [Candidatus Binataceae bacterium]|nr:FAD-binding oxidoreductase [Candidatus Binataceae bacterium]